MASATAKAAAPSLLLLPPPPQPSTRPALNAAYRAPLKAVLTRLKDELASNPGSTSVLVIAVTTPLLSGPVPKRKSLDWNTAQSLLASFYTLISAICTEVSIDTAGDGSVDARVVLVDHQRKRSYEKNFDGVYEKNSTTVYDLASFATTVYPWKKVFHPSTEAGYELLNAYLALAEGRQTILQSQLVAVEGGLSLSTSTASSPTKENSIAGYSTVCLGGTFDHLHPGHKLLLHAAVLLLAVPEANSKKQSVLIVGITGDELLKNKKYAEELQSWNFRAEQVLLFLSTIFNSPLSNTNTLPETTSPSEDERHATFRDGTVLVRLTIIRDPFGPPIAEEDVDVIAVSGETRSGGQAINDKRAEKGWTPLGVYEIDILDADGVMEDSVESTAATATDGFAAKISSTAIRQRKALEKNKI
ncbi:hypothetical protein PT974_06417 [Cladobotryum mycophilum]|uniref:Cytidyltransferase-like domain-containing protein n=1 Tax=Cladobotryum mycophilum TaxID=491253 RepID=A0ABR0SLH7_9HYPO